MVEIFRASPIQFEDERGRFFQFKFYFDGNLLNYEEKERRKLRAEIFRTIMHKRKKYSGFGFSVAMPENVSLFLADYEREDFVREDYGFKREEIFKRKGEILRRVGGIENCLEILEKERELLRKFACSNNGNGSIDYLAKFSADITNF